MRSWRAVCTHCQTRMPLSSACKGRCVYQKVCETASTARAGQECWLGLPQPTGKQASHGQPCSKPRSITRLACTAALPSMSGSLTSVAVVYTRARLPTNDSAHVPSDSSPLLPRRRLSRIWGRVNGGR